MKVYLVWNESRTECVGFTDKRDAEEAAGVKKLGNPCSSLADEWRQMYGGDEMGDQPKLGERVIFEMQELDL